MALLPVLPAGGPAASPVSPSAPGAPAPGSGGIDELLRLARARPDLAWRAGMDISEARNAHNTNTRAEMTAALQSDANYLEGDVRVGPTGQLEMRHDKDGGPPAELSFAQWLAIAKTSGRGVKAELKEGEQIGAFLKELAVAKIPDDRLIINVGLLPANDLLAIRRAHPNAIINLSPPSDQSYSAATITRLQVLARSIGGPVMFPLRLDLVSQGVVDALEGYGRIAIWNTPRLRDPRDDETERLRAMGVDGMIDLREPNGVREKLEAGTLRVVGAIIGWDRTLSILKGVGLLD